MTKFSWLRLLSVCATILLTGALIGGAVPLAASAATTMGEAIKMEWKNLDKAYVAIVIDDNNAELQDCYDLITGEYGFPLCAAVTVNSIRSNPDSIALLKDIEKSGGEILSHTYTHTVLNSNVSEKTIKKEIWGSYAVLTAEGFNINGIITAGGGGTEDTSLEYRQKLEPYTSLCYKYSDYYGASTQYYNGRYWVSGGLSYVQKYVNQAIKNKTFVSLAAHWFSKPDIGGHGGENNWRQVLDWLKKQEEAGKLEVVTYREAHEKATWAKKVDFDEVVDIPHEWNDAYIADGDKHYTTCAICGIKSEAKKHTLTKVNAVDATCDEDGCEAYYTCEKCGEAFSDNKSTKAVDPDDLIIAATSKHVDKNDDNKCDVCKEKLSASTTEGDKEDTDKTTTKKTTAADGDKTTTEAEDDTTTKKTTKKTTKRTRKTTTNTDEDQSQPEIEESEDSAPEEEDPIESTVEDSASEGSEPEDSDEEYAPQDSEPAEDDEEDKSDKPDKDDNDKGGISLPLILGIVGGVLALTGAGVAAYFFYFKKK